MNSENSATVPTWWQTLVAKLHRLSLQSILFLPCWIVFFAIPMLRDPYLHPPLTLSLESTGTMEQIVTVAWHTGQGFNEYESRPLVLAPATESVPFAGTI